MNCLHAERQVFAERDGALEPDERAALAKHLAECPTCRRTHDGLANAIEMWRVEATSAVCPDADRAWQDLRRELRRDQAPVQSGRWMAWIGAPIAVAIAVALSINTAEKKPTGPAKNGSRERDVARAEYVEIPSGNASTFVFVDEKSGWLVVMASDSPRRL